MITGKSPDNTNYLITREVDESLSKSEALYWQTIENAGGVPFQLMFGPKPGEGCFVNIGPGIEKLLGVRPGEFTEKVYCEMIVSIIPLACDISADYTESRKKILNGEIKNYKAEVLLKMKGGEKKWILDSSVPLVDEKTGRVIGANGIFFNIDESKRNFLSIEKVKQKETESELLKNSFLHNVSHEIRTPLNAIIGFTAFLCENEFDHSKSKEFSDIILKNSDQLLEIVNNIIEISEIEANQVKIKNKITDILPVMKRIYSRFRAKALQNNNSLQLVVKDGDDDIKTITDSFKLFQILTHLLDNATKFTECGNVDFGFSVKNNMIEFFVSDTGVGIEYEMKSKIFSRFFKAENNPHHFYGGTGLGLSISKAYVELLGGEIWFESEIDKGSVFYFTLPHILEDSVADLT